MVRNEGGDEGEEGCAGFEVSWAGCGLGEEDSGVVRQLVVLLLLVMAKRGGGSRGSGLSWGCWRDRSGAFWNSVCEEGLICCWDSLMLGVVRLSLFILRKERASTGVII